MRWDKTISTHELKVLAFRSGGIVVSALSGLAALKAFLILSQREAAVLIGLVGYLAFMPLAQFGFGKPCYGEVRNRYVSNNLRLGLVRSFLGMFAWQSGVAAVLFACFAVGFARSQGYGHSLISISFFAIGQAALVGGTYQRDLAYAVSCDPNYENWEFFRRCTALVSYLTILAGLPIWVGGLLCLASAILSQVQISNRLSSVPTLMSEGSSARRWQDLQPKLGANAKRYLAFSFNEQLFYNMPLVVFTILSMRFGIIYFGIWTKLFMLIVLPMRMVVDARVNRQTGLYFIGDTESTYNSLKHSLMLAIVIVMLGILGLFIFKSTLLRWVGAKNLIADHWFIASLTIWSIGNAIQHVFGSFTVSYRDGFSFAFKASVISLVTVGSVFTVSVKMGASSGYALFAGGAAYFACSWIYFYHVWKLVKSSDHARVRGRP